MSSRAASGREISGKFLGVYIPSIYSRGAAPGHRHGSVAGEEQRRHHIPHYYTESDIDSSPDSSRAMADKQTNVSTIVRDDFFNDPFFKDWWADFDLPMRNVQFSRQISGTNESVLKVNQLEKLECVKAA